MLDDNAVLAAGRRDAEVGGGPNPSVPSGREATVGMFMDVLDLTYGGPCFTQSIRTIITLQSLLTIEHTTADDVGASRFGNMPRTKASNPFTRRAESWKPFETRSEIE